MTDLKATKAPADPRLEALRQWLSGVLGTEPRLEPASSDASFRRYFRLAGPGGASLVAMDAPPEHEDTPRFLAVAELMRAAGLHVPAVHAAEPGSGFALLEDLGTRTYLDALGRGSSDADADADTDADGLIGDALGALVRWQAATRPGALPPYDEAALRRELALFPDWYVERHLGRRFTSAQCGEWDAVCAALVDAALSQPQVYVHRDFILRNLMVSDPCPGVIDFQDALIGAVSYDVLTLFRDAFHGWDEDWIAAQVKRYLALARKAGLPVPEDDAVFMRWFDLIGVQRHLKVAGIFVRLAHRDGKRKYLAEIPRFLGYLRAVAPQYAETQALVPLLDAVEGGE